MSTYIRMSTGDTFDFAKLDKESYNVADIARGLTYTNRYNGQLGYMPVAGHSLRVAKMMHNHFVKISGNTVAAWNAYLIGLLHDAAEAYVGDVVSPLKALTPDFCYFERAIQDLIYGQFGAIVAGDLHDILKRYDVEDRAAEMAGEVRNPEPAELEKLYLDEVVKAVSVLYDCASAYGSR